MCAINERKSERELTCGGEPGRVSCVKETRAVSIQCEGAEMTNRELRKLSRADLIEMLIIKCRENEQLREELELAKSRVCEQPAAPAAVPETGDQVQALFRVMQIAAELYFGKSAVKAEDQE